MLPKIEEFNVSKKQTLVVLFILYLFTLGVRIFWLSQKNDIHIDEALSVQLTCRNDWNYESNRGYTGKEAKEIGMLCHNNALNDIHHLWQDNRDPPHTNLYYSFFRLSLIGLNSVDIQQIVLRGCILNLLFFTISFIFFFLLTRQLFPKSPFLQLTATACAFLSAATISNSLFLRPYQIQETSFIVFCYYFFKTLDMEKYIFHSGKAYANIKLIVLMSLVTSFALLTGYFSIIFVGLFGLYAIYQDKKKRGKEILFYAIVLFLAVLFSQTFYLKYLYGYFSVRATETGHALTDHLFFQNTIFMNMYASLIFAVVLALKHFFTYPIIVTYAFCLSLIIIYRKKNILLQKHALYIFTASIAYIIIVLFLVPWRMLRYIMPVFPFFILLPASILYSIEKRKITAITMSLLCIFFVQGALEKSKIEYLVSPRPLHFSEEPASPVFIFNKTPWKYADLAPQFNDLQMYYFNKPDNVNLDDNKEAYLVVERTPETLKTVKLPNVEIGKNFSSWFFVEAKIRPLKNNGSSDSKGSDQAPAPTPKDARLPCVSLQR